MLFILHAFHINHGRDQRADLVETQVDSVTKGKIWALCDVRGPGPGTVSFYQGAVDCDDNVRATALP